MRLRTRLSMLLAASVFFLAGAFVVLFESPASADNCKEARQEHR